MKTVETVSKSKGMSHKIQPQFTFDSFSENHQLKKLRYVFFNVIDLFWKLEKILLFFLAKQLVIGMVYSILHKIMPEYIFLFWNYSIL